MLKITQVLLVINHTSFDSFRGVRTPTFLKKSGMWPTYQNQFGELLAILP
ncbi:MULTISPECIES: hypothetical protein [Fischerella]|nr:MULTISPECIES: hypothetical protein [Fischerella]